MSKALYEHMRRIRREAPMEWTARRAFAPLWAIVWWACALIIVALLSCTFGGW